MPDLPSWLKRLDSALEALPAPADPMMLSQLDGYLAGILVSPDLVLPDEWLAPIWGLQDPAASPFRTKAQLDNAIDLVMKFYTATGSKLDKPGEHYNPIYDIDPDTETPIPNFWLTGFFRAVELRAQSWEALSKSDDEDAATAISVLTALGTLTQGPKEPPSAEAAELLEHAPDLIPFCVERLYEARLRKREADGPSPVSSALSTANLTRPVKVGRNDPCPCGSGKKYKKCCGAVTLN